MADQPDSRRELHSTYVVQDRNNEEEMLRLNLQDQMLTTAVMGGPLLEQADPSQFRRVLDVGCGTGGWLTEVARAYPSIELLIGVDISATMLRYARAQIAEDPALVQRVEFAAMDALRMLEFQDEFFHLVNARLAMSYLRTWDWWKYLTECLRVTRPGGVIRFTEADLPETNSQAYNQLLGLFQKSLYQAGHLFADEKCSVTAELPRLFLRHGLEHIQTKEHRFALRLGTEGYDIYVKDVIHVYRTVLPFFKKWAQVPDNYEEIYQQALRDLQSPDFEGTWTLLTIWGTKALRNPYNDFLQVP